MNSKNLKLAGLLLCILLLVFVSVWGYQNYFNVQNMRGKYTFATTRDNVKSLENIRMNTHQYGEINMYRHDDFWRFKEASDYFVNMDALAEFYNMVNNSVIVSVRKVTPEILKQNGLLSSSEAINGEGQGTEVSIYGDEGKLLNDIILGNSTEDNDYVFARPKGKDIMYVISNVDSFSGEAPAWIPYPLIKIDREIVDSMAFNDVKIESSKIKHLTPDVVVFNKIMSVLDYLYYQGIAYKEDFFSSVKNVKPKKIEIEAVGGLVYDLYVYKVNGYYWLTIDLNYKAVAYEEIFSLVEENRQYYDKWVFQLFDEQGEILYGE